MATNKIEIKEDLDNFAKQTMKNIKISWVKEKKTILGHDDLNCLFNNIILPRAATATAGAASR